jgi:hypothetical protein
MVKSVVGTKAYNVWLDMLRCLVPHGRTHRLSVLVAGMLQGIVGSTKALEL